jgi:hypothetical protein
MPGNVDFFRKLFGFGWGATSANAANDNNTVDNAASNNAPSNSDHDRVIVVAASEYKSNRVPPPSQPSRDLSSMSVSTSSPSSSSSSHLRPEKNRRKRKGPYSPLSEKERSDLVSRLRKHVRNPPRLVDAVKAYRRRVSLSKDPAREDLGKRELLAMKWAFDEGSIANCFSAWIVLEAFLGNMVDYPPRALQVFSLLAKGHKWQAYAMINKWIQEDEEGGLAAPCSI